MRVLIAAACALVVSVTTGALAQVSDDVVKIGVLTDLSGPYADFGGPGSVAAAQLAIEDAGGKVLGKPIELLSADHQNKADVGSALTRQWFDVDKVDAVFDVPNSGVALAVQQVAKQFGRIFVNSGAATTELTGAQCSPTGFHWTSDSYALARGTARAVVKQGLTKWFFVTVDFAGGAALQKDAEAQLARDGATVLGGVRHPLNSPDFSSYMLQAQASKAQVVALANGGNDTVNSIKSASEFGLVQGGQKLVSMFFNIGDVHSLGLKAAQGLTFTEAFYWDLNDETRAFSKRFFARRNAMPSQYQAGVYSGVAHYLKAIRLAGTDEPKAVAAKMRELPVEDFFAHGGVVRQDGRMVHDVYLMEVKKPEQSKGDWDVYNLLATIPGAEAFRPLADGNCPLVTK